MNSFDIKFIKREGGKALFEGGYWMKLRLYQDLVEEEINKDKVGFDINKKTREITYFYFN